MENLRHRRSIFPVLITVILLLGLIFGTYGVSKVSANDDVLPFSNNDINIITDDTPATDQLIVRFDDVLTKESLNDPSSSTLVAAMSDAAGVPLNFVREMSGESSIYRLPSRVSQQVLDEVMQDLRALPYVASVEPDLIMKPDYEPNDPDYSQQWHYFSPTATNYGINVPAAWDITTGSASIVVADIDTGITNHVEFTGRTVPGYDFISDALVANDGNGRDSDPSDPGDWITTVESKTGYFKGCIASNSSWHGTHTAGTIGAASDNGIGVAGINWNSKILPVRVLGKCGGYMSDIIDGMRWAAGLSVSGVPANSNPAKVINMSLGGEGSCSSEMQTAVDEIIAVGTTIVVSAGNSNADAGGYTPASCDGVITVAATNKSGSRAYYSNYGSTVEISAPGGAQSYANDPNGILSTLNTGTTVPVADTYIYYQGTSMAAPHVTGVASLLYSLNPNLTPAQILTYLQTTVTAFPVGSTCSTSTCGSGIVNAGLAVQEIHPTAVDLISFTATGKLRSVLLKWETASELETVGFNLYRSRRADGSRMKLLTTEIIPAQAVGSTGGAVYSYKDKTAKPGVRYYYWLEEVDLNGNTTLYGPEKAKRRIY